MRVLLLLIVTLTFEVFGSSAKTLKEKQATIDGQRQVARLKRRAVDDAIANAEKKERRQAMSARNKNGVKK